MSTLPAVSSQISSAVVLLWISGLAGLSNCCGIQEWGVSLANCSALAMAPFIPSVPGVRTSFAPSIASSVRRSSDMVSGMVRMIWYPLAAATNARAMPVLPLVSAIVDEYLANHYEIERTSYDTGIRHGNLTICGCQRLAAMAGAAAQRHFTGNRPAQGMAEGWTGAAVEGSGDRLRLLDACR